MNFPAIAVRRPITATMIFASVVLLGFISLERIPVQFMPDINPPMMRCRVHYRRPIGVEEMERRIVVPVESMIAQIPGVRGIWCWGDEDGCYFSVRLEFGCDVRYRVIELQEKLDRFRRTFPRDSMWCRAYPADNSRRNTEVMELVLVGPPSDLYLEAVDVDKLEESFREIEGVADIDLWGGRRSFIEVAVEQDRLQEFNIPLYRLRSQVSAHAAEPVFLGKVFYRGVAHYVRMLGQFQHTHELENIIVRQSGNLRLGHVAQVQEMNINRRAIARMDGGPILNIELDKDSSTNPIVFSRRVRKALVDIEKDFPPGYRFIVEEDRAELIVDAIRNLAKIAAIGLVLALIVVFLFVRDVRITLILSLMIPISLIATFNLMYFGNLTINIVSLIGLAIGIGSLLDNGIVVIENIFRYHERGMRADVASIRGTSEVVRAIFGLTITNVVVFLPVVFIEDWIRIIFREGAFAVIFPMAVSAVVALFLVPMLTARVLRLSDRKRKALRQSSESGSGLAAVVSRKLRLISAVRMKSIQSMYGRILKSCLRHRVRLGIVIVLALFWTHFYGTGEIGKGRMEDPQDEDSFRVYLYTTRGTTQEHTLNVCTKVEELISQHVVEKEHIRSWVEDDNATFQVELVPRGQRERTVPEIREALRPYLEQVPEAQVGFERRRFRPEQAAPPVSRGDRGRIEIQGGEQAQLDSLIEKLIPVIEQVPGISEVYTDDFYDLSEMHFRLDRDTAALLQVTPESIARHLSAAQRRGDFSTIRLNRDGEEIDIVFQQVTERRETTAIERWDGGLSFDDMKRLPIFAPTLNTTVRLENLGVFQQVQRADEIRRENQARIVRIYYRLLPTMNHQEVEPALRSIIEGYPLPAGVRMKLGGFSREWEDMMDSVKKVAWIAALLVYMLLAAILESITVPLVIMISVPFAYVGIVWSLLLTHTDFDELAGFGIVFLVGILPNSALLLLHFVQVMRREKSYPRERAMLIAGYNRLRPILMTVSTTVLGLLPMAFGRTENSAWVSFARVAIGGLLSSTILSLIIVPGVYFGVEDIVRLFKRALHWITAWRWGLIVWSSEKRASVRRRLQPPRFPRTEPLALQTKNLTYIYKAPAFYRIPSVLQRLIRSRLVGSPVVGLLPDSRHKIDEALFDHETSLSPRTKALAEIELNVGSGVFGILGPNGAGKSTLLRLLAAVDRPTRGYIAALGYDYARDLKQVRKHVGYLPEKFGVYGRLRAEQYLDYLALLKGIKSKKDRQTAVDRALDLTNLSDCRDIPVGNFSGGMIQRIGLAQIFLSPPRVLIVDEPTAGLDPIERIRFRNLLTQLAADRIVVLSTHIVEDIEHTCSRLAVLQKGRVTFQGDRDALIASAEGCVWRLLTADDAVWAEMRNRFQVMSQERKAEGIQMRIVSSARPHPSAHEVSPTLEDAYLLHLARGAN